MSRVIVVVFLLLTAGCGSVNDYDITFNETLVYSPRPLAVDPAVVDYSLSDCIGQTLADQRPATPEALELLICSQAGIESLVGLTVYRGLRRIRLSQNALTDVTVLNSLPSLRFVDLSDNPSLVCETVPTSGSVEWVLPEHCKS